MHLRRLSVRGGLSTLTQWTGKWIETLHRAAKRAPFISYFSRWFMTKGLYLYARYYLFTSLRCEILYEKFVVRRRLKFRLQVLSNSRGKTGGNETRTKVTRASWRQGNHRVRQRLTPRWRELEAIRNMQGCFGIQRQDASFSGGAEEGRAPCLVLHQQSMSTRKWLTVS